MNRCAKCSKTKANKRCGGCKQVYYCNLGCQRGHWKQHKKACKRMKKKLKHTYTKRGKKDKSNRNKDAKHNSQQHAHSEYEGYILPEQDNGADKPFWGVLRGPIISLYSQRSQRNNLPYNTQNISQYVSIKKYNMTSGEFGLLLLKENDKAASDQFTNIVDQTLSWYYFKNEQNCIKWMKSMQKVIEYIQKNKNKSCAVKYAVVHCGWSVRKNQVVFMALGNDYNLYIYDHNLSNRKLLEVMSLKQFDNVKTNTSKTKNDTLYRFGCILENEHERKPLLFSFKSNNKRFGWITHIDYILYKYRHGHMNDIIGISVDCTDNDIDDYETKRENDIDPLQTLLDVSKTYDEWNKNVKDNGSFHIFLQKQFGLKYTDILNEYHSAICMKESDRARLILNYTDNNSPNSASTEPPKNNGSQWSFTGIISTMFSNFYGNNDTNNEKQNGNVCGDKKCFYLRRHRLRSPLDSKQYDDDALLIKLMDKIHCFLYHSSKDVFRDNISEKFIVD
eukprot:303872_1